MSEPRTFTETECVARDRAAELCAAVAAWLDRNPEVVREGVAEAVEWLSDHDRWAASNAIEDGAKVAFMGGDEEPRPTEAEFRAMVHQGLAEAVASLNFHTLTVSEVVAAGVKVAFTYWLDTPPT
jgi:hypothetical protein